MGATDTAELVGPRASITSAHAPSLPASLSCRPDKRALYAVDTYFRDSWEDASRYLGSALDDFLESHALILVKPDGVAAHRLSVAVDWLRRFGATVVTAERCTLTRHVVRALWQYQWNKATRDRRDLADLLMPSTESLVLIVRRDSPDDVPYTLAVSDAKGPADPAKREPHHLRYTLGNENYLLNFVHTTDEPADMVREIGVLFDAGRRQRIYETIVRRPDGYQEACCEARALESQLPRQDLSLAGALRQLRERTETMPPAAALLGAIDAVESGRSRDWRAICREADELGAPLDRWSTIVIGTHLMTAAEANRDPIVGNVTARDWLMANVSSDEPAAEVAGRVS